ncbi:type II/IV secretion system ATPase subunit [Candidatus Woesearchaeota archaeon]|nr:type II/IV secretion system ATPase subunit [Candidatus Woesearchaeota archaeon]
MPGDGVWTYEVIREGDETILRIDCDKLNRAPSVEDDPVYMAKVVDLLVEAGTATKILLHQKRDYEYDYDQTTLLLELAQLYVRLVRQKDLFSREALSMGGKCLKHADRHYTTVQYLFYRQLKEDPIGAYVHVKRLIRDERIRADQTVDQTELQCIQNYIGVLSYVLKNMDQLQVIIRAKPYLEGLKIGSRDAYRAIFHPIIKPDFMYTKLMAQFPDDGEEIDSYLIGDDSEVTIFQFQDTVKNLYHLMPPEFKLTEEEYDLLDMARNVMAEHKPSKEEFINPKRMREVFFHVGRDLLEELIRYQQLNVPSETVDLLAKILVRYTVGFGLIEVLLQDEKIQDISVNSPAGRLPLFIVHSDYADCDTNIIPTRTEAESWASKLRMISGRPLDEANPILDTELRLDYATARISVISEPFDPTGLAFSFRRHRNKPWTLPLFIKYKMINPMAAGLLSFCVDGTRSMLIAGTRSSGKSSFLTSIMVEIMRRYRILTLEDTLELPSDAMRALGFNIQSMKVASALVRGSSEMNASDGIRSTLRLGDSSLIIGEVRSAEAIALYEAMRVGAAANVVAGTIHGDSPYGVFDRVVNDIGVPKTSFKATDLIIVANPIKSAGGIQRKRRITEITEVRKHWESDPMLEGGFVDLMKYDSKRDELVITDDLLNGDSDVLKAIASNVPDFAGNWEALWQNIELRAKIKELQVSYADKTGNMDLLEAPFSIQCNDMFHLLSEKVKKEMGTMDPKQIIFEWEAWIKRELKMRALKEGGRIPIEQEELVKKTVM